MLADYYTKPLQGNVFRRFRAVIMGYVHINDLLLDPNFKLKERVEKLNNIVIRKSEDNRSNGKVTYAQAVRNNGNGINSRIENLSNDRIEGARVRFE